MGSTFSQRITRGLCSQNWLLIFIAPTLIVLANQTSLATTKIAFEATLDIDSFIYDLYVMDTDGKNPIKLTKGRASDAGADWSPDGKKIAFISTRDGDYEVYVMDADGENTIQLTNSPGFDLNPCWSPDGMKIAFTSQRKGIYDVYVMNADGSNLLNLTKHRKEDRHPSWSPDGMKIAFTSDRHSGAYDIYVMNADGTMARMPQLEEYHSTHGKPSQNRLVSFMVS